MRVHTDSDIESLWSGAQQGTGMRGWGARQKGRRPCPASSMHAQPAFSQPAVQTMAPPTYRHASLGIVQKHLPHPVRGSFLCVSW